MNMLKTFCIALVVVGLTACATTGEPTRPDHATLSETAGKRMPPGMTAAVIYEIDGERVFYGRGRHYVAPGRHVVKAWPEPTGPRSLTPIPGTYADAEGIDVRPLVINVQAGARYYVAAVVRRHRVFTRDGESAAPLGPWRTTVLPVVVRDTET